MSAPRAKSLAARLPLLGVLALSFFAVSWTLSPANGLVFDDYTSISMARFTSYPELFSLWPAAYYNDRPLRLMLVKFLDELFGLQFIPYHYVFVALHLLNVALVYRLAERLLAQFGAQKPAPFALLAAAVFGVWPNSLMAIAWIAATADFLCCLFVLLAALCYLRAKDEPRYRAFYTIASLLLYYLSLRSKEMSLPFAAILLVYELALWLQKKQRRFMSGPLAVHLAFMLAYAASVFVAGGSGFAPDNPYYQSFSPLLLLRNAVRYLFIYFDLSHSSFGFEGYKPAALPGIALFGLAVLFSLWLGLRKRRWGAFAAFASAAGAMVTVLPMVNMQHRLYFYLPSVFIGLFFAAVFCELASLRPGLSPKKWITAAVLLLFCANALGGNTAFKAAWLAQALAERREWEALRRLAPPEPETTYYVEGASEGYSIFFYGPGNALRILFNDASLETELVESFPEYPPAPYVLLRYNAGTIRQMARRDSIPIGENVILSVWPERIVRGSEQFNADGTLFLGIETRYAPQPGKVNLLLDGQALPFVQGEGFVSVTVPPQMLEDGALTVALQDAVSGEMGEAYSVPVE